MAFSGTTGTFAGLYSLICALTDLTLEKARSPAPLFVTTTHRAFAAIFAYFTHPRCAGTAPIFEGDGSIASPPKFSLTTLLTTSTCLLTGPNCTIGTSLTAFVNAPIAVLIDGVITLLLFRSRCAAAPPDSSFTALLTFTARAPAAPSRTVFTLIFEAAPIDAASAWTVQVFLAIKGAATFSTLAALFSGALVVLFARSHTATVNTERSSTTGDLARLLFRELCTGE